MMRFLWLILTVAFIAPVASAGVPGQERPNRFEITIKDAATGKPTPAVVCIHDAAGNPVVPEERLAVFELPYKFGKKLHRTMRVGYHVMPCTFFATNGIIRVTLPRGSYTLLVAKGMEYLSVKETLTSPARRTKKTITLERWIHMKELGWYSLDEHLHGDANEIAPWMDACDLDGGTVFSYWNKNQWRALEPGIHSYQQKPAPALSSMNQEVERREALFGTIHLSNLKRFIPYDPRRANLAYLELAREQGATTGFAGDDMGNEFAVDLALGRIDYWCQGQDPLYYSALNAGFKLPMADGSRLPVMDFFFGNVRTYVKVKGPFSYDALFKGIRAGRTIRSSGAVCFLKINGREPGDTVIVPKKTSTVEVELSAHFHRGVGQAEILRNGKVVKRIPWDNGKPVLNYKGTLDLPESSWFALRVLRGNTHTSPIYVIRGQETIRVEEDVKKLLNRVDAFDRNKARTLAPQERTLVAKARRILQERL